jgi:6-phosphogluconolactonase (cycloisomerase 2 family)
MTGTVYVDVKPAGETNVAPFICNSGMKTPRGIAMDADYIYVANAGNPNITRYDIDTGALDDTSGGSFVCNTHLSDIYGIAVDNSYIYVVNHGVPNVTRYNKATGAYDMTTGGAFSCSGGGDDAYIALDASYIYITNGNADTVTRYDIATGTAHPSGFSCTTTADVGGIAVDSTYIYIANISNNTVTRFTKSSGAAYPTGFSCTVGMSNPIGISVDASYIYVSNFNGNNVTKYHIANGTQVTSPTFACITAMNKPTGNVVTASYIYVLQSSDTGANKDSVTRYDIATGVFDNAGIPIASTVGFNCNTGMKHPNGLLSYGGYLYVINRDTNTVTRYIKLNGVEDNTTGGAFLCNTGMPNPQDVTTDGTYLYVINYTGYVSRHNLVTGALDMTTGGPFSCSTGWYAYGITTDNTYLYVTCWTDQESTFVNKVKRFDIATGNVNSTGFNCNTGHGPAGIAIYGAFIYVTNVFPDTYYTYGTGTFLDTHYTVTRYDLATGALNTSGGFSCSAHMSWPSGVVTDGTYLYVVNYTANTVTRYDIATGIENTNGFLCNTYLKSPYKIAIDTNFIYVTNQDTNTVTRYGIATGSFDNSGVPIPQISTHDYEQDIEFMPGVWQQYSVTFSIDVSAGIFSIDPTSPDYFAIGIIPNKSILNATPAYNFSFTQAQLEYGKTATTFGIRPIAEEELLCQRFFQTSYLKDITPGTINQNRIGSVNCLAGTGTIAGTSNACLLTYILLVPKMRIAPTVTLYAPAAGTAGSIETDSTHPYAITPTIYASDGAITDIVATTNTSTIPALDNAGEWFQFHYTADAEL